MIDRRFLNIGRDLSIIFLSIFIAINISSSGAISEIVAYAAPLGFLASFIAGIFFTSVFTVAPASVALYEIAKSEPIFIVATLGALGALMGDMVLFRFFRDVLTEDVISLFKKSPRKKIELFFKHSYFRWLSVLIGGLIIASPLPDELGLMLMGLTRVKLRQFVAISFAFNFLGVVILGLLSRT